MANVEFSCRATMIGSMPHRDAAEACSLVLRYLGDIPAWPQLPNRSFLEDCFVQFCEGFPGVTIEGMPAEGRSGEERMVVDRSSMREGLRRLESVFNEKQVDEFSISPRFAAGLHRFLSLPVSGMAVKGQVIGPLSWCMSVLDLTGKPVIDDQVAAQGVAQFLGMKAAWQEARLRELNRNVVLFVDEPVLGKWQDSPSVSEARIRALLELVLDSISGLKGIHCCGEPPWSIILETGADIISFDAFSYAGSLLPRCEEVKAFVNAGGALAWGIVPVQPDLLAGESVASLRDRLEETMAPLSRKGMPFRDVVAHSLLTPGCGLDSLADGEAAARALELLAGVSEFMRRRYS